ncbi:MAG: caspase family protein, partial [Myxococcales bacterium]|nr:caspase family protein [Myxococcales bacterium]
MAESTFHVLLIGADRYFPNYLSNEGSYPTLHGCVEDVRRVEAMLRARIAPSALSITTLIAAHGPVPGGDPLGDPSTWPTAANIRRAVAALAERAQPGDQVYLHYSGHGGRVETAWPELKGDRGVDESLVPIDIGVPDAPGQPSCTRAERYIRDVEIAFYLDLLAHRRDGDRRITVTLVFDSCHSGGATRSKGKVAKRSAVGGRMAGPFGSIDRRRLDAVRIYDAELHANMIAAFQRLQPTKLRDPRDRLVTRAARPAKTSWLPPAEGYVLLAGCRDTESAIECSIDGKPSGGVLTGALLEALDDLGRDQSWKTVYDRVLARVQGLFPSQTPQLLGDIDRHVFGTELLPIAHTLTVSDIDPHARTVTFRGGLAMTITAGTQLGVYRPGVTDFSVVDGRVAILTVVHATDLESTAIADATVDLAAIQLGAPAVVNTLLLRRRVELLVREDLPAAVAATQIAALHGVATAMESEAPGVLEIVAPGDTPHYQVALTAQGRFEICDPQGTPFVDLAPVISVGAPRAASAVVAQLRRLGRFHTVLDMAEPDSDLRDQLQVELLRAPPGWTDERSTLPTGGTPLVHDDGAYTVPSGTWLWLRVTNREPGRPLNIALIDLVRTWEIEMIVPNPRETRGRSYETIADRPRTFAFCMYTLVPEALDVLKLFIAVGDVDFRALTTTTGTRVPSAGTRVLGAVTRSGGATRAPSTALGRLIHEINATRPRTRDAMPARSLSSP